MDTRGVPLAAPRHGLWGVFFHRCALEAGFRANLSKNRAFLRIDHRSARRASRRGEP